MSRDTAALLYEPPPIPESLNRLLEQQLAEVRGRGGELDLPELLKLVSAHYDRVDSERRGIVRSMQLMSDEAQALTREIREQSASQLQAILDNVKDAIVTVDDSGHIESFNPTGDVRWARPFAFKDRERERRGVRTFQERRIGRLCAPRGGDRCHGDATGETDEQDHAEVRAHAPRERRAKSIPRNLKRMTVHQ